MLIVKRNTSSLKKKIEIMIFFFKTVNHKALKFFVQSSKKPNFKKFESKKRDETTEKIPIIRVKKKIAKNYHKHKFFPKKKNIKSKSFLKKLCLDMHKKCFVKFHKLLSLKSIKKFYTNNNRNNVFTKIKRKMVLKYFTDWYKLSVKMKGFHLVKCILLKQCTQIEHNVYFTLHLMLKILKNKRCLKEMPYLRVI